MSSRKYVSDLRKPGSTRPHSLWSCSVAAVRILAGLDLGLAVKTIVPLVRKDCASTASASRKARSSWVLLGDLGRPKLTLRKKTAYFIGIYW